MNRPIRILELRSVRGTGGGPEKTILNGAARSDPQQFAVTVCYIRDDRDDVFGIDGVAGGLPVDYVEVREKHSLDPSILGKLRSLIRQRRIDIVHAHEYKTDLLAWALSRVEPIIPLATAHGWTGHSARERRFYYPVDKQLLARFPAVVAVSGDIRNQLIRRGARPERIYTILNGIDHVRFARRAELRSGVRHALGLTNETVVIGAVGRLEPQKRFDLLLDAFASLRRRHGNLALLVAGDGSLRDPLAAQVARLGLDGSCRLLGHRADIIDLHHAMDLFVQSSDYEGTPNAVLEAMALETPIVATDVGGTAEVARHDIDGLIIQAGNADLLEGAVEAFLENRGAAIDRTVNARRRVETVLSFDARMKALESIYVDLFDHHARRPETATVARA
jgi:glycosyltransferase involved in cell wall biosynthesis